MRRTCSSTIPAGDQVSSQPHASVRKRVRISVPYGVWTTSGWNWIPKIDRSRSSIAATGEALEDASAVNPGGGS